MNTIILSILIIVVIFSLIYGHRNFCTNRKLISIIEYKNQKIESLNERIIELEADPNILDDIGISKFLKKDDINRLDSMVNWKGIQRDQIPAEQYKKFNALIKFLRKEIIY